jgi:prepilin-type N-terminal cleavage/methylation domain-containing protein
MGAAKVRDRKGLTGFTLLELIVALAIAAAVVVGLSAAVGLAADVASRGRDRADERLRAEAARSAVRDWLEGTYVSGELGDPGFVGRDAAMLGRPMDEVSFVSLNPGLIGSADGSPIWLRLHVAGEAGLVAEYRELRSRGVFGSIVVEPNVRGMNIRYLVQMAGRLRWLDGWSSKVRAPAAVEIEFDMAGGSAPEASSLPLLVALWMPG